MPWQIGDLSCLLHENDVIEAHLSAKFIRKREISGGRSTMIIFSPGQLPFVRQFFVDTLFGKQLFYQVKLLLYIAMLCTKTTVTSWLGNHQTFVLAIIAGGLSICPLVL